MQTKFVKLLAAMQLSVSAFPLKDDINGDNKVDVWGYLGDYLLKKQCLSQKNELKKAKYKGKIYQSRLYDIECKIENF